MWFSSMRCISRTLVNFDPLAKGPRWVHTFCTFSSSGKGKNLSSKPAGGSWEKSTASRMLDNLRLVCTPVKKNKMNMAQQVQTSLSNTLPQHERMDSNSFALQEFQEFVLYRLFHYQFILNLTIVLHQVLHHQSDLITVYRFSPKTDHQIDNASSHFQCQKKKK